MSLTDQLLNLKNEIANAQSNKDRAEGKKESLFNQLKEMGFDNEQQAKQELNSIAKKRQQMDEELEKEINELSKKIGEKENGWKNKFAKLQIKLAKEIKTIHLNPMVSYDFILSAHKDGDMFSYEGDKVKVSDILHNIIEDDKIVQYAFLSNGRILAFSEPIPEKPPLPEKPKFKYEILRADTSGQLAEKIEKHLNDGWSLIGGVHNHRDNSFWYQSMIKEI